MPAIYLKTAAPRPLAESNDLRDTVALMLREIEAGGEDTVRTYAQKLDGWTGPIALSAADRAAAIARVPEALKKDIRFAYTNIRRFAEAQKATLTECEIEVMDGLIAGQKLIPVSSAGCYVPGGRYSHIASALMTVTTAKVAGVPHITATSPPRPNVGVPDAIVFAMDLAGADVILNLGGVQGIAAMAQGLFGAQPADILVGPGNSYVAEAKRILFGKVGIDMFAGPTDSLVIADNSADAKTVAWDLVSQAEHGADSPVWLVTTSKSLAEDVQNLAHDLIASLPEPNATAARRAWDERAEVILCDSREEAAAVADQYAPEHLHVMAEDLDWWLGRLSAYGSLFLGKETTVSFGDKVSGPNHVLPTSGAARYTGGLSVHKFIKTVTWQRCNSKASQELAHRTARISRVEGMEGHARAAEQRLNDTNATAK
jgi:sulfopropanediol 3-dehydrogenase